MTYPSTVKYAFIGKESTWNTSVTADKKVGIIISDINTPHSAEVIESKGVGAIDTQKVNSGIKSTSVDLNGDFQNGRLLEYLIGSVSHSDTTGDWEHTFTISNTPPSATFEVGNSLSAGDTVQTLPGMIAESGELSINLNENLRLSATFQGSGDVTTSSTASSFSNMTLPVFPHALCSVSVNGSEADEVQSASISINKTVERSGGVGSNTYQQGHSTDISFEYTATLGFTDTTYHDIFADGTVHEFNITGDNGATLGSGQRKVSLTLENCTSTGINEQTSVGGLTFVEISGTGTLKECKSVDDVSDTNW